MRRLNDKEEMIPARELETILPGDQHIKLCSKKLGSFRIKTREYVYGTGNSRYIEKKAEYRTAFYNESSVCW